MAFLRAARVIVYDDWLKMSFLKLIQKHDSTYDDFNSFSNINKIINRDVCI